MAQTLQIMFEKIKGDRMNILAVKKNKFQINELTEFFTEHKLISTETDNAAVQILKSKKIELVLISINSHSDFGLVKYINDNFKNTKVVLSIQKEMQAAFSVLTGGNYTAVQNPMKLKELKNALKKTIRLRSEKYSELR